MKRHIAVVLFTVLAMPASVSAQTAAATAPANPYLVNLGGVSVPNLPAYLALLGWVATYRPLPPAPPYTMAPEIPRDQKVTLMQGLMSLMPKMGIRDVMNMMTIKYKAKPGLSFDDVVESMKLRANQLNFKLVGHSPMWKDFIAVLDDRSAPRVEVFHYCDIAAGREVLKAAPEAVVYLPCRIAVMEDASKQIWVLTLDWDLAWLDTVNDKLGINPELARYARDIREKMDEIMRAAANGDL